MCACSERRESEREKERGREGDRVCVCRGGAGGRGNIKCPDYTGKVFRRKGRKFMVGAGHAR